MSPSEAAVGERPKALDGIRVVEIGAGVSAPFAARLWADLGADVVKVEPPNGDSCRHMPTREDGVDRRARGLLFEILNRGKRSVVVDPRRASEDLPGMIAHADILIVGDDVRLLEEWNLDIDALRGSWPTLTIVTVTAFGCNGPYRDWRASDLVLQAMGGLMSFSGDRDREPLKRGLRQIAYTAGLNAGFGGLAGVLAARRTERGAHVDVSALESVAAELVLNEPTYAFMGAIQGRRPSSKDPFSGEPVAVKDGFATIQTNSRTTLAMFADLLECPALAADEFNTQAKRIANAEELATIVSAALGRFRGSELFERASKAGLLAGFAQGARDLLQCPQLRHRGVFQACSVGLTDGGPARRVKIPAAWVSLSSTPIGPSAAAPALGTHGPPSVVWSDAPHRTPKAGGAAVGSAACHAARPETDRPRLGPLAGIKVLDLSSVVAVPLIGAMLCDLGADLVKVEAPDRLDQGRGPVFGPLFSNDPAQQPWNRSGAFQNLNRGKRSIGLNLKDPRGREILRQLVSQADILLENFTPRVMPGWSMSYAELAADNPRLIMLSNTGYGSTGPWSSFKAQGTSLEATMGVGSYTGYPGERPTKVGQSYPDFLAAWAGLNAVLATLLFRERTGKGQWIDLGMYQLGPFVIPEALIDVQVGQPDPGRTGNRDVDVLLSGVFPAEGDDRWVAISVDHEETMSHLADLVPGVPHHLPRAPAARQGACADAIRALAAWTATRSARDATVALQRCGVAAGPVNDARDLLLDPHLYERCFYEEHDYGMDLGRVPLIGRAFRWTSSGSVVTIRGRAPNFGEHNDEVLDELCVGEDERTVLRRDGVIADVPVSLPILASADLDAGLRDGIYREVDRHYRERLAQRPTATGWSHSTLGT